MIEFLSETPLPKLLLFAFAFYYTIMNFFTTKTDQEAPTRSYTPTEEQSAYINEKSSTAIWFTLFLFIFYLVIKSVNTRAEEREKQQRIKKQEQEEIERNMNPVLANAREIEENMNPELLKQERENHKKED